MGILLDIVPNHMAVVGNENPWWNDVLENGPSSPFSGYFDIAWTAATRNELQGRVLIPVLGEPYAKVLEAQQLRLVFEAGAFSIQLFRSPLSRRAAELQRAPQPPSGGAGRPAERRATRPCSNIKAS